MNIHHPAYRAALRIDPIAADFWQQHKTPSAGIRLRGIAETIEEEYRTVDANPKALPDDALWRLIRAVEEDEPSPVVRLLARELKEALGR